VVHPELDDQQQRCAICDARVCTGINEPPNGSGEPTTGLPNRVNLSALVNLSRGSSLLRLRGYESLASAPGRDGANAAAWSRLSAFDLTPAGSCMQN
jgi:hypothetical protein